MHNMSGRPADRKIAQVDTAARMNVHRLGRKACYRTTAHTTDHAYEQVAHATVRTPLALTVGVVEQWQPGLRILMSFSIDLWKL
eukprot:1384472-Amorphochlora_amoeboformis.AAC.2